MILFSSKLKIKDTLTKDEFISLVIQWNQNSLYDNKIPDIEWNGERNIRYGSDKLWLDIEEYRNGNIIATRFEKRQENGAVWDSDYIMNFDTMEMTIQLDRSYVKDSDMDNMEFSCPYFIRTLIDNEYVEDDGNLVVSYRPHSIDSSNTAVLVDALRGDVRYALPIVYVSKTALNADPLYAVDLSWKLKGIAHVLLQEDVSVDVAIGDGEDLNVAKMGAVQVRLPNGKSKLFPYRSYSGSEENLLNKVSDYVFQYVCLQKLPPLATWFGVTSAMMQDKYDSKKAEKEEADRERQKAVDEVEYYVGAFDDDIEKLRRQIEELARENNSLQMENQGLRMKLSGSRNAPVIYLGLEEEFFPGEIREMIMDAVSEAAKSLEDGTRRKDVLQDILSNNEYAELRAEKAQNIKNMFRGYSTLSGTLRHELKELGFEISEEGKHIKLTYYGDERYKTIMAKTGSDHREGKNIAATIIREML